MANLGKVLRSSLAFLTGPMLDKAGHAAMLRELKLASLILAEMPMVGMVAK